MASDPLSDVSHKARTYLLGLSAAGLLTSWYGVKIQDIQSVGLEVKFTDDLVPLTLTVSIGYFLTSFILYAIDDYVNLPETLFQQRRMSDIRGELKDKTDRAAKRLRELFGNLFKTGDIEKTMDRLLDYCHRYRELSKEHFAETMGPDVNSILEIHCELDIDTEGDHYRRVFDVVMQGLDACKQSFFILDKVNPDSVSPRYSFYRRYRFWAFDICLPIVVAVAALTSMWWHSLPL